MKSKSDNNINNSILTDDLTEDKKCSNNSIGYIEGAYDTEVIWFNSSGGTKTYRIGEISFF